jgi:hypothetical protein
MLAFKNFIKNLLNNYPLFRFIILYFFRKLKLSARALNSDFPISNKNSFLGYNEAFCSNKKNEGFFLRFIPSSNNNLYFIGKFYSLVRSHLFGYEILRAQKKKYINLNTNSYQNKLIAISHFNKKKQIFKVNADKKKYLIELEPEKFSYLNFKAKKVKIESDHEFIISKDFLKKKEKKNNNKLVVGIFIDGLSNFSNNDLFKKIAPETYNFFKKGNIFQNHFSNSEWTVPSCATIMTGKNTLNHGIFHPNANHDISKKNKVMAQFFQENNFVTLMCNSGWRTSPSYGYVKGFDRTIYKKEASADFLINKSIDHLISFKSYDNFIFLGLNDLHHNLDLVPPLNLQINSDPSLLYELENNKKIKSIDELFSNKKIKILKQNMNILDKKLSILYEYLIKNHKDNFVISIFTDHGHSFLDDNNYILSKSRTSIPFLLRTNLKKNKSNFISNKKLSSNIDILPTLLGASNLRVNNMKFDGINLFEKNNFNNDIIIESIYPNKKYEAKIINNNSEYIFNVDNIIDNNGKIILKGNLNRFNPKVKFLLNRIKIWNRKHILNHKNF